MIKYAAKIIRYASGPPATGAYFALDSKGNPQFYAEAHWKLLYTDKFKLMSDLELYCPGATFVIEEHFKAKA